MAVPVVQGDAMGDQDVFLDEKLLKDGVDDRLVPVFDGLLAFLDSHALDWEVSFQAFVRVIKLLLFVELLVVEENDVEPIALRFFGHIDEFPAQGIFQEPMESLEELIVF